MSSMSPVELRDAWRAHKSTIGGRNRDIAAALGVSEATLIASAVGDGVVRLRPRWPALVQACAALGEVMVLIRNDHAVLEKHGRMRNLELGEHMGQVVDASIDLRLFFSGWRCAFAVQEPGPRGPRRSVQVFDRHGTAVIKLYPEDAAAWETLAEELRHPDQAPGVRTEGPRQPSTPLPDASIDVKALRADWQAMRNTHEFFGLLRRHGVERLQALRVAGDDLAYELDAAATLEILTRVAATGLPIMIFVGNGNAIQIHTGPIHRVKPIDGWLNVLDRDTSLHLWSAGVHSTWLVRKPSDAGDIYSVELYDARGAEIALLFGVRKNRPESAQWLADWRTLVTALPRARC